MSESGQNPAPKNADCRVADAIAGSWVDTRAPVWTRPLLRLSRADRPIGAWLLLLPCWWGLALAIASDPLSIRAEDGWILAGCALGALVMRGAGCTWNDVVDRDLDGQVERTRSRPLPSGQVSLRQAVAWMVVQAAIGLAILVTFNFSAIALGLASMLPVAIYPFAKRFTWWPQLFLGVAFNWGALLAWAAHANSLGAAPALLFLSGICWTLFYDTIYAHQDREDDALVGIKSTARMFQRGTKGWLVGFLTAAVALMIAALWAAIPPGSRPIAFAIGCCGVAGFALHLHWQLRNLDIDDSNGCLRLFRSNRNAGLLPAVSFFVAALYGLS